MTAINSLGAVKRHRYQIWGHCGRSDCGGGRQLDIDKLISMFGEEHPVGTGDKRIANALVCTRCGHKGGSTALHPPLDSDTYRKATGG